MLFNVPYRLIFSGAALRRVNSGDTEIDGKKIPNGTYLVYSTGETHSDPNIYPNPSQVLGTIQVAMLRAKIKRRRMVSLDGVSH
ncbi:cytochrome P450 domain-containing protein [Rhizoctonia solani AG-1 IA]|uniref:Cytochrome P450 domain-containing protein n=1 Tax=Thanatephorus cucumeris (strain AG1-IA) TaxID=983506 RepID=L8WBS1_THACA|nr:cytochrome P450 domain-containing protein [Rhizoctonia solani AG-1 IA]